MKILITGSEGQLGKELLRVLNKDNKYYIIPTNKKDLDISNFDLVNEFIKKNAVDIVINCAAYTKVDLCETNKELAFKVNALGPKNLAIACEKIGAKFVQISTDYVFDGYSKKPYCEYDNINPISIYGKSKALGEFYTRLFSKKYFIIRTAWLYGDGNNFVKTMLNLSKTKNSIDLVNDQYGSPTSTKDLVKCIKNLIHTENYGTYHGTCNGVCTWYEFACKIFEIKNININVNPVTSMDFKTIAKRPTFSVLDNFMLRINNIDTFNYWEDSLVEYLNNK